MILLFTWLWDCIEINITLRHRSGQWRLELVLQLIQSVAKHAKVISGSTQDEAKSDISIWYNSYLCYYLMFFAKVVLVPFLSSALFAMCICILANVHTTFSTAAVHTCTSQRQLQCWRCCLTVGNKLECCRSRSLKMQDMGQKVHCGNICFFVYSM